MLQKIAQVLSRTGLAVIVGLLTFVFIFTSPFNNNSEGCGTGGQVRYAARVYGTSLTTGDFDAALALTAFAMSGGRALRLPNAVAAQYDLRNHLMDGLVERALLARHAESLGFSADQELVWRQLREKGTALLSVGAEAKLLIPRTIPLPVKSEDGKFDTEATANFIENGLRRGLGDFAESQRQEQLAERMRELVAATVLIEEGEVWDAYVREKDRAVISYARFRPDFFADQLEPSDQDIDAYLASHREPLEGEYETRKAEFEDIPREIVARHILVRLEEGATDAQQQEAERRAAGILEKIRGERESFGALARRYSDDNASARRGGRLPGRNRPEAVENALLELTTGQVSAVVRSERGLHLLLAEGVREGTLDKERAIRELAVDAFRREEGLKLAHIQAEAARAAMNSGTSLAQALTDLGYGPEESIDDDPLIGDRPALADQPAAERSRWIRRGGMPISGVTSPALNATIFDELTLSSPVIKRVLEVGGELIVLRLEERETPTREEFTDAIRERLSDGLLASKRDEAIQIFVHALRQQAEKDGAIVVNEALLEYKEDDAAS